MTIGLLVVILAACREQGRPDPNIHMALSHDPEQVAASPGSAPSIPSRLVVPPEVEKAYSGISLRWKDSQTGKEGTIEVPLGGAVKLADSDLEVRGDVFLPNFTMSRDAITSSGIEEGNPATRITVLEKGQQIFSGWIFTKFPDVHPFQHARFSLHLEGGVRRASS